MDQNISIVPKVQKYQLFLQKSPSILRIEDLSGMNSVFRHEKNIHNYETITFISSEYKNCVSIFN